MILLCNNRAKVLHLFGTYLASDIDMQEPCHSVLVLRIIIKNYHRFAVLSFSMQESCQNKMCLTSCNFHARQTFIFPASFMPNTIFSEIDPEKWEFYTFLSNPSVEQQNFPKKNKLQKPQERACLCQGNMILF